MCLTSPFWGLGHALWEVDDARYAEVPREMVASGDWATPRLNELDYVEKPPLWYWLAAASYKIFGVSEAAARLPLALLSMLGLLATAWLGSWLYSPRTGLIAAAALASSGLYIFLSHYITLDLALSVFLLLTSAMIMRVLAKPEDARWASCAAWAFAGLAFLSKGLVALIFPAAWTAVLLLLLPRLRSAGLKLVASPGPLLMAAIVAPWFLAMEERHPGFLRVFFVEQHFQRYLDPAKYNRGQPWFFFLWVLPAGLLPWTPVLVAGIRRAPLDWRQAALLSWSAIVLLFFSASSSKLATYILPILPHLCLAGARGLEALERERLVLRSAAAGLGLGIAMLIGGGLADEHLSCQRLALAIAETRRPEDRVYAYGIYLHGLPFYTRHRVDRLVNWTGELHYAKRDPATSDRFGDDMAIRELPLPDRRVFVVLRSKEDAYFLTLTKPGTLKSWRHFGKWTLAEF